MVPDMGGRAVIRVRLFTEAVNVRYYYYVCILSYSVRFVLWFQPKRIDPVAQRNQNLVMGTKRGG